MMGNALVLCCMDSLHVGNLTTQLPHNLATLKPEEEVAGIVQVQ